MQTQSPLEHCRAMFQQWLNAETLAEHCALYLDFIGHNPADDGETDVVEIRAILRDYIKEVSAPYGLEWSDVARGFTAAQIKRETLRGFQVYWANPGYRVHVDKLDQWFITFTPANHSIGLTWQDGVSMNGKPEQFFMLE